MCEVFCLDWKLNVGFSPSKDKCNTMFDYCADDEAGKMITSSTCSADSTVELDCTASEGLMAVLIGLVCQCVRSQAH